MQGYQNELNWCPSLIPSFCPRILLKLPYQCKMVSVHFAPTGRGTPPPADKEHVLDWWPWDPDLPLILNFSQCQHKLNMDRGSGSLSQLQLPVWGTIKGGTRVRHMQVEIKPAENIWALSALQIRNSHLVLHTQSACRAAACVLLSEGLVLYAAVSHDPWQVCRGEGRACGSRGHACLSPKVH